MKKKGTMQREPFRKPGAERRYMNRIREIEKKQRHQPIGRMTWEEA